MNDNGDAKASDGDTSVDELCEVIDFEVKSPLVADLTKDDADVNQESDTKGTESSGDKKDVQLSKSDAVKRPAETSADKTPSKVARNEEVAVLSLLERMKTVHTDYGKWLCLLNLPESWSDAETEQLLRVECSSTDTVQILSNNEVNVRVVLLRFNTAKLCDDAYKIFKNKTFENKNPDVFRRNEGMFTQKFKQYIEDVKAARGETGEVIISRHNADDSKPKLEHHLDIWEEDKTGLYGLNEKILKEKGIKVPLSHWVCVRNFKGTRCELKEIMDIAGNVMTCRLFQTAPFNAKVKYSHPIEAAQAVSLFNGQFYKGKALEVIIEDAPKANLPTGLSKLGLGFGADGSPVKDITRLYERRLRGKDARLNESWFTDAAKAEKAEHVLKDTKQSEKKDHQQSGAAKAEAKLDSKIVELVNGLISKGVKVNDILSALRSIKIPSKTVDLTKTGSRDDSKVGQLRPKSFASEKRPVLPAPVRKTVPPQNRSPLPQRSNNNQGPWSKGPVLPDTPMNNPFRNRGSNGSFNGSGFGSGSQDQGPPGPIAVWAENRGNNMGMNAPMAPNAGMNAPMGPNMGMNAPMGPNMGINVPIVGQNMGRNVPVGGQNINLPMGGQNMGPMGMNNAMSNSLIVEFNNLPASMSYNFLRDKMAQCGSVQFVSMTKPGSAMVRFMNDWEAKRCVETFNNTVVEGHRIDVRYC